MRGCGALHAGRWLAAPVEALWSPGNVQVITIIVPLVLIGGSFTVLDKTGILKVALSLIVARFKRNKYLLRAVIILFFMLASSVLGIYEEAAATVDPFMVTIAQSLAGLPLYSGLWLRAVLLSRCSRWCSCLLGGHARKVGRDPACSLVHDENVRLHSSVDLAGAIAGAEVAARPRLRAAVRWLGYWLLAAIVFIFAAVRIGAVSSFAFPITGLFFAIARNGAALAAGVSGRALGSCFVTGMRSIVPAVVMILRAMSVKLIITNGGILDTILQAAAGKVEGVGLYAAVVFVYLTTLVFEFFIPSASVKALLIIPILAPLADLVGLARQTVVFAFDNGDGFANILDPTNPFLMICPGPTVVSYPKWFRWTLPLQAVTVLVCLVFMFCAVAVRFGPF